MIDLLLRSLVYNFRCQFRRGALAQRANLLAKRARACLKGNVETQVREIQRIMSSGRDIAFPTEGSVELGNNVENRAFVWPELMTAVSTPVYTVEQIEMRTERGRTLFDSVRMTFDATRVLSTDLSRRLRDGVSLFSSSASCLKDVFGIRTTSWAAAFVRSSQTCSMN